MHQLAVPPPLGVNPVVPWVGLDGDLLRTALWIVRGGLLLFIPWRAIARPEC